MAVDRVFRLDHDPHQHFAGEILKPGDDGQAAGELGYQAVREQIGRLHARVQAIHQFLIIGLGHGDEPVRRSLRDDLGETVERSAADEQDVGRIDVLRATQLDLRAFHDLQQRVLDAFARVALTRVVGCLELVDLVDIHDSVLSAGDLAIGLVDQALQDRLDLFVDVPRLRQ